VSLAVGLLLWVLLAALMVASARRSTSLVHDGVRTGAIEFFHLLPRIVIGVVGAGYVAAAVPRDVIGQWLGPDSGMIGLAIAVIGGAITPGGPVVGFSIGAAALKGGAGAPQVIAYSTAWALYAVQRLVVYEVPMMPPRVVWLRAAVSLPLPFLAAFAAMLAGKP
jgi:uncharacterized membrane protein YraQ (UPF0718 family)